MTSLSQVIGHRAAALVLWGFSVWCVLSSMGCAARVFISSKQTSLLDHAIFIGPDGTPALVYDSRGHSLNTSTLFPMDTLNIERKRLQLPVLRPDNHEYVTSLDRYRNLNYNYEEYVRRIADSLDKSKNTKRVLIFIHGGRNTLAGALSNSSAILRAIEAESDTTFPILVNYESGDLSSYLEHLRNPRPERRNILEQAYTLLRPPVRLLADVGTGIGRGPLTLYQEIAREYGMIGAAARTTIPDRFEIDSLHVNYGGFEESGPQRTVTMTWGLATSPFRLALGLLIATAAPGEWESMRRRSEFALRPPDEFSRDHWADGFCPASGAVAILLDALSPVIDRRALRVTLVGHSTGTILANEILRLHTGIQATASQPSPRKNSSGGSIHPHWKFDDIVFMAAACSVREFESGVLPYLEANPHTRFYNLCLHPVAELRESFLPYLGQIVYRGSLLTWIDDYLDRPLGPVDRTMGRAENCLAAQHEWEGVRSRIYIRVLDYHPPKSARVMGKGTHPVRKKDTEKEFKVERHSQFSDVKSQFWKRDFWWPEDEGASTPVTPSSSGPSRSASSRSPTKP